MGSLITNYIRISGPGDDLSVHTERRFLSLMTEKKINLDIGESMDICLDLDRLLPEPEEMALIRNHFPLVTIGLAVSGEEGERVLSQIVNSAHDDDPYIMRAAISGHLTPGSILSRAKIEVGPDLMNRAEARFPGCLVAAEHAIRAWRFYQETDPERWSLQVRGARIIDTDATIHRDVDGSLSLSFYSVDKAASGIFCAFASCLPNAMILMLAVDEDSDYSYSAITNGPGEVVEAEFYDEESSIRVYQEIHGPNSLPYRHTKERDDLNM